MKQCYTQSILGPGMRSEQIWVVDCECGKKMVESRGHVNLTHPPTYRMVCRCGREEIGYKPYPLKDFEVWNEVNGEGPAWEETS